MSDDHQLQELYAAVESAVGPENVEVTMMRLSAALSQEEPAAQAFIVGALIEDPHSVIAALDQAFAPDYEGDDHAVEQEFHTELAESKQRIEGQGIPFSEEAFNGLLESQPGEYY